MRRDISNEKTKIEVRLLIPFVKTENFNLFLKSIATAPTIFDIPVAPNRKTIGGLRTPEEMSELLTALFKKLSESYDAQELLKNVSENLKNKNFPEGHLFVIAHLFVKSDGKNSS